MTIQVLNDTKHITAFDFYTFLSEVIEASEQGKFVLSDKSEHFPQASFNGSFTVTLVPFVAPKQWNFNKKKAAKDVQETDATPKDNE